MMLSFEKKYIKTLSMLRLAIDYSNILLSVNIVNSKNAPIPVSISDFSTLFLLNINLLQSKDKILFHSSLFFIKQLVVDTHTFLKEVIQPQLPLGLPCYDFTPVMNHKVVSAQISYPLLLQPTPMV